MSATRASKTAAIQELSKSVAKAPHAFLIDFKGLSVPAVTDLRRQIKRAKSEYVVVKNTLVLRAIKGAPLGALSEHFTGMMGVAYSQTDAVALAKVLHSFGKTNPAVKVKAALLDGKAVPASSLEALANLPTRTALVARLLGLMQSPLRRLVTVLSAPQRNLAATLAVIAKDKDKQKEKPA
jgi:large subunit ribosomal protein L10